MTGILDRTGFLVVLSMPLVALTNLFVLTKIMGLAIRPTDLLFVSASTLCVVKLLLTMRLDKSLLPYFFTIGGLLAATLLGILLFDNAVDWPRYVRFLQTLSWGALAFTFIRRPGQLDAYATMVVLISAITGAVSIGLYAIDPTLHRIAGYFSFAGGEGLDRQASYNEWGALYALSLTILLWRLYQGRLSNAQVVAMGILLGGLSLAQSRSAFLAVAAVIIILLSLHAKKLYLEGLRGRSAIAILGLVVPIAFVVIASRSLSVNRLTESFVAGTNAEFSMENRFGLWQMSLDLWNAGPFRFLLGYGSQSFATLIDSPTADSFYLDHGLSDGFLGLVFVLGLLITPTLAAALRGRSGSRVTLGALVMTVALTVSLTGNVLVDPTYGGVTFSLLYGLLSVHERGLRLPAAG